jgi:hypothetical protein
MECVLVIFCSAGCRMARCEFVISHSVVSTLF